jgi:hypothetical protein
MFLSVTDDEIFQAGLSNIENIINLFKYANERRDMTIKAAAIWWSVTWVYHALSKMA